MNSRYAALLTSFIALTLATPAHAIGSATPPVWQNAHRVALPSGATGLPQGYLPALSCPSAGNCSVGGAYSNAAGNTQGLLLSEVSGVWKSPTTLSPPKSAANNPALTIYSLDCGAPGNCSAVGGFQNKSGDTQSFVDNENATAWSRAKLVTLPSNALGSGQSSQVHSVACASAGNCSAVGTYLDNSTPIARSVGYTINKVSGVWGNAVELRLPSDANFNPFVIVNQVACASPGTCAGVGTYINAHNDTRGFVASEVRGKWLPAIEVALPGDANAYPATSLNEVTCAAPGDCTALGTYENTAGSVEGFTVNESDYVLHRAVAMEMPPSDAVNSHVFFYGFEGISCPTISDCSAGGQYLDQSGHYQGFLIDESHGTWRRATELRLPAGAQSAGKNGGVVAVSCSSTGNCSAGAAYSDAGGNYQASIVNEVAGVWLAATPIALPSGATTVGVAGGVYALKCHPNAPCTATGSYLSTSSVYQGFIVASH